MLLTVDIGNTHTVLGVFKGDQLIADWRMASSAQRTADESWLTIKSFCTDAGIRPSYIKGVGISSVVPNLTDIFESIARKYLNVNPVTISASLDLGIKVHYKDPSAVGADRLCNAIAGFKKFGGPLIIIDFGTATTFDVVSKDGDYLGGVIALGLESAASELHRKAAKLPKIDLQFPDQVIATETVKSMQAGIMFGAVDAVEGIVRRIKSELEGKAKVIATGGLSTTVARHTDVIEACELSLVLEGIRLIYERVEGKSRKE
ncbi:MAG: type III pantothenate kinase [Ignavibacteriae bacterium]|nr:type III pantothenate kinase [Ignavibacteriota bacterium]